jgi:lysophospholipid acyltransferase (LPLAT)-like uncharacterized protein
LDIRGDSPTPPASTPDERLPSPSPPSRPKGAGFYAAAWALYAVVRALAFTYRIRIFHDEGPRLARNHHPKGSYCIALWHEYLFASIIAHRHLPFAPLASLSKDGDLVTFVMDRLGFKTIRGSSSRRGEEARTDMVDITDHGWFTAITVDGPRGPRRRVKGGIVDVARRSGVAIVPLVAAADREWILSRSWDQFKIPKPFARIAVRYGDPIIVPENTQGMAFGEAKKAVRDGLAKAELDARQDIETWGSHD